MVKSLVVPHHLLDGGERLLVGRQTEHALVLTKNGVGEDAVEGQPGELPVVAVLSEQERSRHIPFPQGFTSLFGIDVTKEVSDVSP